MSESEDGGPGRREVAHRLFAAEFDDADREFSESDRERAPNYVVTPTGARVNRLFVVGVLTETEDVSDEVIRARVVDPTGAFVLYAGQYQPDERAFLERVDPPSFVAVTGKARTFQPEDSDRVFTSVRPESISTVDAETRDRWTVDASEATLDRVDAMATAIALGATGDRLQTALVDRGIDDDHAAGIALALEHYGTTPTHLEEVRTMAVEALRHVAGDLDEVSPLAVEPDASGDVTATDLLDEPIEPLAADEPAEASDQPTDEPTVEPTEDTPEPETSEFDDEVPDARDDAETQSGGPSAGAGDAATATDADTEERESTEVESGEQETTEGAGAASGATDGEASASEAVDADGAASEASAGPGDFEAGEYDLDAEEREEVESEYGTEFQSGTEVDEPGEADIETPEPEDVGEEAGGETADTTTAESEPADEGADAQAADEEASTATDADAGDVDLVDAVVAAMEDLDEGDGASRPAVVEQVSEETGADFDAVEEAVQDALMDGRCYEPDDETLKPI